MIFQPRVWQVSQSDMKIVSWGVTQKLPWGNYGQESAVSSDKVATAHAYMQRKKEETRKGGEKGWSTAHQAGCK